MITIKIRDSENNVIKLNGSLDKPISIRTKGGNASSIYTSIGDDGLTLYKVSLSYADWYNMFIAGKQAAMRSGNTTTSLYYTFEKGLKGVYVDNSKGVPYVRTVGGCQPLPDGQLFILGDKHITIYPKDSKLLLGAFKRFDILCSLLTEVYIFSWVLYHAYNYLMMRLVYYRPTYKYLMSECLGRCCGTLLEYQAQLAIFNHRVWRSAYLCNIDTVTEKVAVGMGYVSQDCDTCGVLMLIKYSIDPDVLFPEDADNKTKIEIAEAWNALTIFRSGKSVNAGGVSINTGDLEPRKVVMIKSYGNNDDKVIHGTGYETVLDDTAGDDSQLMDPATANIPDTWSDIQIAVLLGPMKRRQRYYEVFSLAVATGVLKELQLPASPDQAHNFKVKLDLSWYVFRDNLAVDSVASGMDKANWYKGDLVTRAKQWATPLNRTDHTNPVAIDVTLPEAEEQE